MTPEEKQQTQMALTHSTEKETKQSKDEQSTMENQHKNGHHKRNQSGTFQQQ